MNYPDTQKKHPVDLKILSNLPDSLIKALLQLIADLVYEAQEDETGIWKYHFLAGDFNRLVDYRSIPDTSDVDWEHFVHSEDRELLKQQKVDLVAGKPALIEYRIITPDGQVRWIRDYACRLNDEMKSKIKISGVIQNVTQQKAIDEETQKRAKLYERLIETSQDGFSLLDLEGNILFCNQQKAKMLGYNSPDDLIGKPGLNLIVPEERELATQCLQKVLKKESVKNLELKVLKKDGSHLDAEFNVILIEDKDGNPWQMMDVFRDNTERKQAQQELLETEERFRKAFYLSTDPMCINRLKDGKVLEINDAFLHFSGYSRDEIIGHSILEFGIFNNKQELRHCIKLFLKYQRLNNFEAQFNTKTGEKKVGLISANELVLHNEVHILSIIRDITHRKLYEENLRLMNEELEQHVRERTQELELANQQLESFNYSVSHDLKAPLRGIDGFSYVLLEEFAGCLDEQARDYLVRIRKNAQNMGHLFDALLKLSQISQQVLNLKAVNLSLLVTNITEDFKSQEVGRQFEFIIAEGILVYADERLMAITLQNLIDNAVKFTAKREITIIEFGARIIDKIRTFFIRDNGIGFNNRYREKVFQPFHRLHSNKDFAGTGIGLSIVNRIITKHSGKIWADSEENKGTTFYFTLEASSH